MKQYLFLSFLLMLPFCSSAQQITRNYDHRSMSDVLVDLDKVSSHQRISFIYNELEDFTVTCHVSARTVPEAIRQAIGFYPIAMTVTDSLITVECVQKETQKLIARIVDHRGVPMAFVNVALLNPSDSSFITGGVSNEAGDVVIPCRAPRVLLRATYVGFKTLTVMVSTRRVGDLHMTPDSYTLKDVTVAGNRKTDYVDHSVYTFSAEQIRHARQSHDLLATLPGILVDPVTHQVSNLMGKRMKVLLNGVEATDNDLKLVPADKIKNVLYYTEPPSRYAGADIVLNVITRPLDRGYAVGVDVWNAVNTVMGDNRTYARYNWGHHQLSFDYANNIRNYRSRYYEQHYRFTHPDGTLADYHYQGRDHFGYINNNFRLKYTFSRPDDITFQAVLAPSWAYVFSRGTQTIAATGNPAWHDGHGTQNEWTKTFGPSLNLYLEKQFAHRQTLTADVVGTWYNNRQRNATVQKTAFNDSVLVDDDMTSRNHKYSVIGEVDYQKAWPKSMLNIGYTGRWSQSDYTISNVLSGYQPYDYASSYQLHNVYGDYAWAIGRWSWKVGATANYVETSNTDTRFHKFYVTPKLLAARNFKHSQLKFHFGFGLNVPPVARLSNSSSVIIPGLIRQGNPWLKTGGEYNALVTFSHEASWVSFRVQASAVYTDKPQNAYYQWKTVNGQRTIVSSYENAVCQWEGGVTGLLQLKPFKSDLLTADLWTCAYFTHIRSRLIGNRTFWYTPLRYNINFRKGCWGAGFQGVIPSKRLTGMVLTSDENKQHLSVFWQKGPWHVGVTCLWLFTKARYSNKTVDNPVMNKTSNTWINDNRSTVALNLSWNFFSGKKKVISRSIHNQDGDSGAL